jgi:ferric-dicitrate binding protein FerR (iron transport regulator)
MNEEKYWILVSKKIAGEATAEEQELLQDLIDANPEWKTNLENLQELWNSRPPVNEMEKHQKNNDAYLLHINRLKDAVPEFESEARTIDIIEEQTLSPIKKRYFNRFLAYTALIFLLAGAVFFLFFLNEKKHPVQTATGLESKTLNEISISKGSRSRILLPDGSKVWINSGSKLTYENYFKGNTREVQLDGEAYFDVVKDAAHPFIVHTSGIDIKVLGTAFNVKAFKMEPTIEATLIHGSIEIVDKNQPGSPKIMLKPHEKLIYNKYPSLDEITSQDSRVGTRPAAEDAYSITIKPLNKNIADTNIVETAWVYNKLVFEDERFEDLALRMEKWFNIEVRFENDKLKNSKISGSFLNETVEEAFKELQFLIPFSYVIKNNEVKIMRK